MCTKLIKPYTPTPLLEIFYFCLNINLKYVSFHLISCVFGLKVCVFTKLKVIAFDLKGCVFST